MFKVVSVFQKLSSGGLEYPKVWMFLDASGAEGPVFTVFKTQKRCPWAAGICILNVLPLLKSTFLGQLPFASDLLELIQSRPRE